MPILPTTLLDLFTLALISLPISYSPATAPKPFWDSLKRVSLRLEIVGTHESWATHYGQELGYCRRHLEELRDAPRLSSSLIFQRTETMLAWLTHRRDYLHHRRYLCLYQWDAYCDELQEVDKIIRVWDMARQTQQETHSFGQRRRALAELLRVLGPKAFYSGELPMPR